MRSDSILILCLDSYGDLTLRQPLFRSLLDAGRRVAVAVRKPYDRLLPFLDGRLEAVVTDLNPYELPRGTFWSRAAALQAGIEAWGPDLLVAGLYNRTPLDQWLLRRSRAATLGFANPRLPDADLDAQASQPPNATPALTRSISVGEETAETEKNQALIEGILGPNHPGSRPAIQVPDEERALALRTLQGLGLEPGRYAFASPAGAANNALKSWRPEVFLGVVGHLDRRHGLRTLVTGVAVEAPFLDGLVEGAAERGLRLGRWVGGPDDLGVLLGLIQQSRLYLGSDTGPMHFAAALEVPVLALFGGGHWPRFLPSAKRSFVATRQLPCFGCGWECWLPEAACVTTVDQGTLLDGADWLLSDRAPANRVDLGTPLDEESQGLVRDGAARYRRTWSRATTAERWCRMLEEDQRALLAQRDLQEENRRSLEERLAASELQATRLRIGLEEQEAHSRAQEERLEASELEATRLRIGLEEQEAHSRAQEERLEASELEATRLRIGLQQQEAHSRAQDDCIRLLKEQVERLSTAPAALRVLSAVTLRRVGLFDLARRGRQRMKRVSSQPPSQPPSLAEPAPPPAEAPAKAQPMPLLEAFVLARSLPGDTGELALERLHELGARLSSVLCLHPSPKSAQAALMLASGGAQVAWLGEPSTLNGVTAPGLSAPAPDLGSWLIESGSSSVPAGNALLLDAEGDEETLRLLRFRLAPDTAVLVNGDPARARWAESLPEPARESLEGLAVFESPPVEWQDPAQVDPQYEARLPWVAPPRPLGLPERLPSGRPWPRISVVTVSLNQGQYLEQTLLSVLRQDYPDLEYIVVDGGSTDGSRKILEKYRGQLAHCIIEPDKGQSDALNKGFALATGGILAWLNSDDRYPAGALWRAAVAFDSYAVDVVAGGCRLARDGDHDMLHVHHSSLPVGRVVPLPLERILDLDGSWLKGDFFYQPEVFWTRDIWERSGGRVAHDLFYSMDYELWARMARHGARAVHVPDTLAVYRVHQNQKTAGVDTLPYAPELRRVALELRRQWALP